MTATLTKNSSATRPVDDASGIRTRPASPAGPDLHRAYFPKSRVTRPPVDGPTFSEIVARYCFGEDE